MVNYPPVNGDETDLDLATTFYVIVNRYGRSKPYFKTPAKGMFTRTMREYDGQFPGPVRIYKTVDGSAWKCIFNSEAPLMKMYEDDQISFEELHASIAW